MVSLTEAAPEFSAGGAEGFQGGTSMRILCSEGGQSQKGGAEAPACPP